MEKKIMRKSDMLLGYIAMAGSKGRPYIEIISWWRTNTRKKIDPSTGSGHYTDYPPGIYLKRLLVRGAIKKIRKTPRYLSIYVANESGIKYLNNRTKLGFFKKEQVMTGNHMLG